jgi:hypothetical protein
MRHARHARLLLLGSIVFTFLAQPLPAAGSDIEHDFDGIPWAANLSAVSGLTEVYRAGDVVYCTRSSQNPAQNSLNLGAAVYGFFQGKFFAVHIPVQTEEDFQHAKNSLTADYGRPRAQYRVHQDIYIWQQKQIKIKLKHDAKDRRHKLSFYYTPLSEKLNEERSEETVETVIRPE